MFGDTKVLEKMPLTELPKDRGSMDVPWGEPDLFVRDVIWCWIPSGKLTQLWKITIFNGKTHYKWSFSIVMLVYQRVDWWNKCRKPCLFYIWHIFDIVWEGCCQLSLEATLEWCWYSLLLNFPFSLAWTQELVCLLVNDLGVSFDILVTPTQAQYTRWSSQTILGDIVPWYPWKV